MVADRSGQAGTSARWRILLLAVLLLAAALRWLQPGQVEFKYDEVNITRQALGVAGGGALPLLSGGTTLGIQRGALDVYLLALPLALLGRHIEAAVWWLGCLGVMAVALSYGLGRRVAGPRVGLLTALFMAVNPWLIVYDRKLWAHIQVVFSVLLLLLAWDVVVRRKRPAAFWFPVIAALQGLAHTLALVQALSWLGAIAVAPRRWRTRAAGWGLLAGAALCAPYAWALIRRWLTHGVGSAAQIAADAPAAKPAAAVLAAIRGAWREGFYLATGSGISRLVTRTPQRNPWWLAASILSVVAGLLIFVGLIRLILWARRGPRADGARLLLAWTVGPVVALSLGVMTVATQYWTALLPLPALLLALGLDCLLPAFPLPAERLSLRGKVSSGARIALSGGLKPLRPLRSPTEMLCNRPPATGRFASRQRPALRWAQRPRPPAADYLTGALAALIALVWIGSYVALTAAVAAGAGGAAFGVPLTRWQETLATTRAWAAQVGTDQVRVAVNGVDPGYDGEPAAVALLLGNPPWARFVAPERPASLLMSYDRPSLYLWAIRDVETEALLARVGQQVWEKPLAEGHAGARLYLLPPAASADPVLDLKKLSPEPVFDAGMALVGYAFPETWPAEEEVEVTLLWRVLDPSAEVRERDFTAFNHVLTAGGERVAQVDGLSLLSRDWWPGDVLVQRYRIAVPEPGAYRWRVGLYSRADGGRAQVLTGGDYVDLGPVIVR